jgi:hypothetical protein
MPVRLRQVALVASELEPAVDAICANFGLVVAYRDPEVAAFGLVNAVMPVGHQFLEVVAPTREGTAAGRQMERIGGDGGYMVICQVSTLEEQDAARQRASALGVREAFAHRAEEGRSSICQFHPGDTGGSFLEVDCDTTAGGWSPAGPDWESSVRTDRVRAISGVTIGSPEPELTASTWAAILGIPVTDVRIVLENGVSIAFVPADRHSLVEVALQGRAQPVELGRVRLAANS